MKEFSQKNDITYPKFLCASKMTIFPAPKNYDLNILPT